tara:strand:- start:1317 stop:1460 length:144 start_codon:yes stop_codon:yes gene_type:complete
MFNKQNKPHGFMNGITKNGKNLPYNNNYDGQKYSLVNKKMINSLSLA